MNIFLKPLLGVSILGGALFVAGCNAASTDAASNAAANNTAASDTGAANGQPVAGGAHENAHSGAMAGMTGMRARTHTTKLAFSSSPSAIPVGRPATWNLRISDAKSGAAVNAFEVEMTKQMHLIVVKNDLSWFNHLHPRFLGNGKFTVTTQVPSAGTYKIYADYTLKGAGQEVPQFEFATNGQRPKPAGVVLSPDKMRGMWLVNRFNAHPESEPDARGGAVYEVALMPMPTPIKAGQDTLLHFQIRDAKGAPVKDLQPYLGAMGHCVVLSSDTNSYLHSHPMSQNQGDADHHSMGSMGGMKMEGMAMSAPPSGGPDVMFHTNFPQAGLYKVWGQFRHRDKIITASYIVSVAPGQSAPAAQTKTEAGEQGAHAH